MKDEIKKILGQNDDDEVSPPIFWDACKAVLRGVIIAKMTALKKQNLKNLTNLEFKLKILQREHKKTLKPDLENEMQLVKTQINKIESKNIIKNLQYVKQKNRNRQQIIQITGS